MTEFDFKKLLTRYETGECTTEERKLIESWLDSHYIEASPFKSDTDKTRTKKAIKASIFHMANINTKVNTQRYGYLQPIMKIAASIVFIISLGLGGLKYYQYVEYDKYSTEIVVSSAKIQKILFIRLGDQKYPVKKLLPSKRTQRCRGYYRKLCLSTIKPKANPGNRATVLALKRRGRS